jgi:hypothetical protein
VCAFVHCPLPHPTPICHPSVKCHPALTARPLSLRCPPSPSACCSLVHDIIGKHSDLMAMFNEFLMRCEVGPDDPYTRQYPRDRNRVSGGRQWHGD